MAAAPVSRERSLFVTNLAWLLIVIGGIATAGAVLNLVLGLAMSAFALASPHAQKVAAPGAGLPLVLAIHGLYAAASGLLTWAGVGLLRRREWARRVIVSCLVLGVIASLLIALAVLAIAALAVVDARAAGAGSIAFGLAVVGALLTGSGGAAALQWWIARRLRSAPALEEFRYPGDGPAEDLTWTRPAP
jgi:hypothetical protein